MRDLAVSLAASLSAWVALGWFFRGRGPGARNVVRAMGTAGEPAPPTQRRPLLAPASERFARTRAGQRLAGYASRVHPAFSFSDVFTIGLAAMLAGALAGFLLLPFGPLPLVSMLAGPVLADRVFIQLNGRRTARMEKQLPEALALQSSALRAGNSLLGSLRYLAEEPGPPLSEEISRTVREIDLGSHPEAALDRLAVRIGSSDVDLWVAAMLVHRLTGGNLAAVVEALSQRVRDRLQLRGEVKALTAQGRMSGIVVAAAPLAFLVLLSLTSRDQMQVLYQTSTGWVLLVSGLAMEAAGFFWIRLILRVKP